jgi:hypothetical protein
MPKLEHTSVPPWAVGQEPSASDRTGTSYVLVGVGADARIVVEEWANELALYHVDALAGDDAETLAPLLTATLSAGRVGLRVRIAGPTGACLALRAAALTAGLEDDELHIRPTAHGAIDLWCVHCGATTAAAAAIDDVVPCSGCGRRLLVYYHVSRRTGRFLGFQVDAEEAASWAV